MERRSFLGMLGLVIGIGSVKANSIPQKTEPDAFQPNMDQQFKLRKPLVPIDNYDMHYAQGPKLETMQLNDCSEKMSLYMRLHDKQVISTETLCEKFGINYDQEIARLRLEDAANCEQINAAHELERLRIKCLEQV